VVANRTHATAVRLAESLEVPSRAVELSALDAAIAGADLVVSCTGATGLVLTAPQVAAQGVGSDGRDRFFLDLALPHDVDPAVGALPGVRLAGLEELRTAQEAAQAIGPEAVEAVRRIVRDEVEAFLSAARAAAVAPTVVALRTKAAAVVESELTRLAGRLPELDERAVKEIQQTVRRVADKLLHAPTVRVKELAAAPGGDSYADALRRLFDLDPKAPVAVARADMSADAGPGEPAPGSASAPWSGSARTVEGSRAADEAAGTRVADAAKAAEVARVTRVECAEADCVSGAPAGGAADPVDAGTVNAQAASVRAVSARGGAAREGEQS
jgi:glutamyl-tRNA reductase